MKLYNTLTKDVDDFKPLNGNEVRIYSCGPTVYDHIHIGNLSSFIYADTLHRVLRSAGYDVTHVMNITDVDDKTIKRSREKYPELEPKAALEKLTDEYTEKFFDDMKAIGNDVEAVKFVKATDNIPAMQKLIKKLHEGGFAYATDDGVYFSIEKYRKSGKKYGQLTEITESNTSAARIQNDEYDKESAHDFALWKKQKPGEPAWEFELDGQDLTGRPGWHIECSAMSVGELGQPFDIHTGGVDLMFPHHENEIAQSTAGEGTDLLAKLFFHSEHMHVEGKKMSKSLGNFITLEDIKKKGYDPLAFRLMVLQSHYSSQSNFTWENLEAAHNRLKKITDLSYYRFQAHTGSKQLSEGHFKDKASSFPGALQSNMDLPMAMRVIGDAYSDIEQFGLETSQLDGFNAFIRVIDSLFGLKLSNLTDVTDAQKKLMVSREQAREQNAWDKSDELRKELEKQGIGINDTPNGPIWYRL